MPEKFSKADVEFAAVFAGRVLLGLVSAKAAEMLIAVTSNKVVIVFMTRPSEIERLIEDKTGDRTCKLGRETHRIGYGLLKNPSNPVKFYACYHKITS
jgi:hypothetical protein